MIFLKEKVNLEKSNFKFFNKLFMKNIIVVTGGAGFVGSNLIHHLIKKTKFKIISIDNYSSGFKKKSC